MNNPDPTASVRTSWRRKLTPEHLAPDLIAGLVASAVELPLALAFATLIFSGSMAEFTSRGIGFLLMGQIVLVAVIALGSSASGVISCPQDSPAAIMALVALALVKAMPGAPLETVFFTTIAAMTITAMSTGLIFFLIGWFNQGNLVRFIPYPVIGGFLAGTGLLLFEGGISVMAGVEVNLGKLDAFTDLDMIAHWLPGLIFAILLIGLLRRHNHALLVPGVLITTGIIFYGMLAISGTSLHAATAHGWLMEKFDTGAGELWQPLRLSEWRAVDWDALGGQAGNMVSILIVSIISLLLNATGLELATERDINLNQELKAAGIGNLIAGLGGGLAGYHALGTSVLMHRMGARTRLPGIIVAVTMLLLLFVGSDLITYVPQLILGGLIVFLGLDFLVGWLVDTWGKLPKTDFAIIVLIMLVIERVGFLQGISLGILVAAGSFVINYSRINVVKHALTGQTYHSAVLRASDENSLLAQHGDGLSILKLQGFVFFGTANTLLETVRDCFNDETCPERRCILMDFRAVTGLDSSATLSFAKMRQLAQNEGATLLFTALPPHIYQQMTPDIFKGDDDPVCKVFVDLDHGVEWAEEQIIAAYREHITDVVGEFQTAQLESTLLDHHLVTQLLPYLTHTDVAEGTYLVHQGDPPQGLIFIRQGSITILLERDDAPPIRLRTVHKNTFVGEIGVYLDQPATASVITGTPASVSCLTVEALARLEAEKPEVASALHRFMARFLSERVTQTTNTLNALID